MPGQIVSFLDDGNPIGRARGSVGTLRFEPATSGGRHQIVAVVSSFGRPRARLVVASYVARDATRPARVKRLRARRSGNRIVATWKRVPNAARYAVDATLSDGRHVIVRQRGTRFTLPATARRTRATISVAGLRGDGRRGPSTRVRVR